MVEKGPEKNLSLTRNRTLTLVMTRCNALSIELIKLTVIVVIYSYFEKRLLEKVHVTILKGIVGGFEFTVLQRNLKEWRERPRTYVCEL